MRGPLLGGLRGSGARQAAMQRTLHQQVCVSAGSGRAPDMSASAFRRLADAVRPSATARPSTLRFRWPFLRAVSPRLASSPGRTRGRSCGNKGASRGRAA
jgi:hypothetical protein